MKRVFLYSIAIILSAFAAVVISVKGMAEVKSDTIIIPLSSLKRKLRI